jgi:hypothetical protein
VRDVVNRRELAFRYYCPVWDRTLRIIAADADNLVQRAHCEVEIAFVAFLRSDHSVGFIAQMELNGTRA